MELTTTLKRCREFKACDDRYEKLEAYLGKNFEDSQPIPLSTILKSNGIEDTVWALRCTEQSSIELSKILVTRLAEIVWQVWDEYNQKDKSLPECLKMVKLYLLGKISQQELAGAADAATAAAAHVASAADAADAAAAHVASAADAATAAAAHVAAADDAATAAYAAYVATASAAHAAYAAAKDLNLKQALRDEVLKAVTKPKEYIENLKKAWRIE